ncbi:hypothetical protein BC937DRAFT_95262 [Endogone sp. FLAS-F59071]|nr:hypothetical protein BC937DRAFT_95262 [Endogone sp. FLAS-F59071]|eukprot:RUS20424.1 hypothetical protein BC937DRAFT_95262 [Endogone sp. FLAS-F59071]
MAYLLLRSFQPQTRTILPVKIAGPSRLFRRSSAGHSLSPTQKSFPKTLDFVAIEKKWVERWKETRLLDQSQGYEAGKTSKDKEKYYVLSMFPYPSGMLHMGHVRVYTISDVLARFWKMYGYKVIHPMGWDAFGLPAENAAIERGINPADWTMQNITEVTTSDPTYYRWTQHLFLRLYRAGLAYQKEAVVNWDPIDETVVDAPWAPFCMQVDSEGRSWRSGAVVERRKLRQWFFKITNFAEVGFSFEIVVPWQSTVNLRSRDLLKDLDHLDRWPDRVKQMQKHWIGRSKGAEFQFEVIPASAISTISPSLTVFTSRPDTIFGVQYLVVAPEHSLIDAKYLPLEHVQQVTSFVDDLKKSQNYNDLDKNKEGKEPHSSFLTSNPCIFTGLHAVHPFTHALLPIYVAPYVLSDYGTGAVMGVPAHDERDWEFAKFNSIVPEKEIKFVVEPIMKEKHDAVLKHGPFTAQGVLTEQAGPFKRMKSEEAMEAIVAEAENGGFGRWTVQYRLRDWLVSRQRYWGAPIPIIHCPACNVVPVPESDLPIILPTDVCFTGRGGSPLKQVDDWVSVECPQCHGPAKRDTDTMDTFVDSSWYFMRYTDSENDEVYVE